MGSLILPTSGQVYLDTNIFIYTVEKIEPYFSFLKPLWLKVAEQKISVISSELVILETLIRPLREKDIVLENTFNNLFKANGVQLIPVTEKVWRKAALLRAEYRLNVADAIHTATAITEKATLFISNDNEFKKLENLPFINLSDYKIS